MRNDKYLVRITWAGNSFNDPDIVTELEIEADNSHTAVGRAMLLLDRPRTTKYDEFAVKNVTTENITPGWR